MKDIFLSWFWQPNNVLATFILTFDSKSHSWITNFAPALQNFSKMNTSSAPDSAETKEKTRNVTKESFDVLKRFSNTKGSSASSQNEEKCKFFARLPQIT